MRAGVRLVVGAISGLSWGVGAAVLLQQFGFAALDLKFLIGVAVTSSLISWLWARRGQQRLRSSVIVPLLLMGVGLISLGTAPSSMVQVRGFPAACPSVESISVPLTSDSECVAGESIRLSDTGLYRPFRLGANRWFLLQLDEGLLDSQGGRWELWIEFAGVRVDLPGGRYPGGITTLRLAIDLGDDEPLFYLDRDGSSLRSVPLEESWWAELTKLDNLIGVYHIGGTVSSAAGSSEDKDFDGYIDFGGNPFSLNNPIGWVGLSLTIAGLVGAWIAAHPGRLGRKPNRGTRRERLRSDGEPVLVDTIAVSSPGLDGELNVRHPRPGEAFASTTGWAQSLVDAFVEHHAEVQLVVEIAEARELTDFGADDTPTTRHGEPAVVVEVPGPEEGWGQFVVATDESGVAGWGHPIKGAEGAEGRQSYAIPRRVGPVEEGAPPPLLGQLGSKLLNVIVFPLLDPVFGAVGERFAGAWESKKRPYRFRTFSSGDYNRPEADEPDWEVLASGKSLLMVHGTFSQAHTGFGGLSSEFVDNIADLYQGRVFAFDHYTLSEDPRRNIQWLFDHLPDGIELDLDIMCHSRGGLVSRVLAEKQDVIETGDRRVRVDKIVFAAAPNAGTILADPEHLGDLVDSYTNLMNFTVVPLVADAVITVVKYAAVGILRGLDGLQAMDPQGEFLEWLNSPADNPSKYFAISGDFEPDNQGWKQYAADRLMDRIFQEANDLVVPTASVYAPNGSNHFPLTNRLEFDESDGVHHSGYFGHPAARDQLLEWLRS